MRKIPVISAQEAALLVNDGDTISTGGFLSAGSPETLNKALEQRFLETGHPRDLTLFFAACQGNRDGSGGDRYAHEGMLKRAVGGHWDRAPKLGEMALAGKFEAYDLPQGVIAQLFREIAANRPGILTHVGLETFVDPRVEGGKVNQAARDAGDIVKLMEINGEEKLFYPAFPIDIAVIRATYADEHGNCTFEKEGVYADALVQAQAAHNSGGKVIVQVEQVVSGGSLDARLVRLPGIYVDAVVVAEAKHHMQSFGTQYNPAFSGETRIPLDALKPLPMSERKIIARRAAMELVPHAVTNLGIGMPEGVAAVAAEEGLSDMVLTTEIGAVGGVPAGGMDFGAATNVECILDQPTQFDFYDGSGLDVAFLGLAQMDQAGNINVSKFGPKVTGCGGFINISQNAKKVVYCGTFTAGGLQTAVEQGKLRILREGRSKKLVEQVEQITFSGSYAIRHGQPVLYVTERAVFELTPEGVELKEIAPGIDPQKDVLDQMDFHPIIKNVTQMDPRIFQEGLMGLKEQVHD